MRRFSASAPCGPAEPTGSPSTEPKPSSQDSFDTSAGSDKSTAPSTPPTQSRRASLTSWDMTSFTDHAYLYPSDQNGDWRTALKDPNASIDWPEVRNSITSTLDSAADTLSDRLNHAFQGHDLPALHDKVLNLMPSVSMPTMHQISRGVDDLADGVQAILRRQKSAEFLDEELTGDHFAFARCMGGKARRDLVAKGICREWQVAATRETLQWQIRLDEALMRVFRNEKEAFSVAQLFGMTPVWKGDVEEKVWKLKLDTGLMEVIGGPGEAEVGEKRICLDVGFGLPESAGCVKIEDVERDAFDDGEWMVVE
jgi:hypothetical protein